MSDILKVLRHSFSDRNLHSRDPKRLHQVGRIRMRSDRGPEAWHGYADYAFPVPAELVEC